LKVKKKGAVDNSADVEKLVSTMEEHSAAINQLKDVPDQISMILGLLTDNSNAPEERSIEIPADPISDLLGKPLEDGMVHISKDLIFSLKSVPGLTIDFS